MAARKPYSLRLSDSEQVKLEELARQHGMVPAVLLREILNQLSQVKPENWRSSDVLSPEGVASLRFEVNGGPDAQ